MMSSKLAATQAQESIELADGAVIVDQRQGTAAHMDANAVDANAVDANAVDANAVEANAVDADTAARDGKRERGGRGGGKARRRGASK